MKGCLLSASDQRLLRGQALRISGRTVQRTLNASGLRSGSYNVSVACNDLPNSSFSDLRIRPDGSMLLRSDCLDLWHDSKYADIVPGYGRRLEPAVATTTGAACRKLSPLTEDEYQRAGREAYLRIGQIVEREVRRVSAAEGIPICQAIGEVFKPVDTVGRRIPLTPSQIGSTVIPTAGYLSDGFFPALYREWTDGLFRMDGIADCSSGNQSLRLTAGTWARCGSGVEFSDPHQMFPIYVFDRPECPTNLTRHDLNPASVCIVWGDRIGNNIPGGTGKVFAADATNASGTGARDTHTYDCEDRALRTGQFVNVDVHFQPTLT